MSWIPDQCHFACSVTSGMTWPEAWRTANAVSMDDRKVLLTSMLVASLDGSIRKDYVAFDHWFCCPPGCFSVE